jgi:hypothetical protein
MSLGSVVHELALGKGGGFEIYEGDSWRSKEAREFYDFAQSLGKTPMKRADFDRASEIVTNLRASLHEWGLDYVLTEGESEKAAVWKEGEHYMRAMFDRWIPSRNEIWDIKTTGKSAHPEQISRIVPAMHYDLRSEFYLMGAAKLTGIPAVKGGLGFQFLFVETEPPYAVTPCFLDASFRERGKREAFKAIDTWKRCMESNNWPGYVNGAVEIQAPGWVDFEIEDETGDFGGAKIL